MKKKKNAALKLPNIKIDENSHIKQADGSSLPGWMLSAQKTPKFANENTIIFSGFINDELRMANLLPQGKDKWPQWPNIHNLDTYNIAIITEMNRGKTYGSNLFYLRKGYNILNVVNTDGLADMNAERLLKKYKKDFPEEFNNWTYDKNDHKITDNKGVDRIWFAAHTTIYSIKGPRDFIADVIICDEFNQAIKFAEQKGRTIKGGMSTIASRVKEPGGSIDHIYYFGNKNKTFEPTSTSLFNDWGVYTLSDLGEVSVVYHRLDGFDEYFPDVIILNSKYTEDQIQKQKAEWMKDRKKYANELSDLIGGDAEAVYFNIDRNEAHSENIYAINPYPVQSIEYVHYGPHWIEFHWIKEPEEPNADWPWLWVKITKFDSIPKGVKLYSFNTEPTEGVTKITPATYFRIQKLYASYKIIYATPYVRGLWEEYWRK